MNLKFYAYAENSIPVQSERVPGSIIYTEQGNHYLVKQDKTLMKITSFETGFNNQADLLAKNPAKEGKIYLTNDNQLFIYRGSEYIRLTQDKEIIGGFTDYQDLISSNPAKPNTLFITQDGKVYIYTNSKYKEVGPDQRVYSGYSSKTAIIIENPKIENILYLTTKGELFYYNGTSYVEISKEKLRNKKEKLIYNEDGEIIRLEYSIDNFATVLIEKTYAYDVDGTITSETIKDYETAKQTVNTFSYNVGGNISEIATVVTDII